MVGTGSSISLGDVADIVMGQSPPGDSVSTDPRGLPLLNGPTEFGPHHPLPVQFTTDVRRRAIPGDILFCVRGSTTGRMNWADREYAIGRGVAAIRHKRNPELQPLVRAVIEYHLGDLLSEATGSTFPNVSAEQLARIPYPRFPEAEQRAIAHILGTLDDKTELNRQMNETLEGMAQAIFKAWFVDFDPVRAKMEGRWKRGESLPGLPAHLYDLFPDRLVDSELGKIPEGWEVSRLDQIAHFLNGLPLQKHPSRNGLTLPVIKIAQLRKGDTQGADRCSVELPMQYVVDDGDVLFSWSGSLECVMWAGGRGGLNQHLFKVTSDDYPRWFCYFWIREHLPALRSIAVDKATTMGHIQRYHLSESRVLVPSYSLLQAANDVIAPLLNRALNVRIAARTMAEMRNAVLPKLISGEITVIDAEQFVEGEGP